MQQLSEVWGDIAGWAAVLAGLAALAGLVVWTGRKSRVAPRAQAEPEKLGHAREWELVMRRATQELSCGTELAALQASAALKIESAEHAFNRLAADCARLCRMPSALPAREPLPFPNRHETLPSMPEQRRLAA